MDNKRTKISIIVLSIFMLGNALAYDAYNLHDDLWAVECKDGKLETYIGDETGLEKQGAKLCKDSGGVLGESTELTIKIFDSSKHTPSVIVRGLENDTIDEILSEIEEPLDRKQLSSQTPTEEEK